MYIQCSFFHYKHQLLQILQTIWAALHSAVSFAQDILKQPTFTNSSLVELICEVQIATALRINKGQISSKFV
jgi:hypothetical protein